MMESHEQEVVRRSAATTQDPKTRRMLKYLGLTAIIIALGLVAICLSIYFGLKGTAQDGTELAQQIKQECDSPGITDPDLAQFCPKADKIVDDAPDDVKANPVPGPPGVTGAPGEQGPSGEQGEIGATGPTPTTAQVSLAVQRLCSTTDLCRGANGTNGSNATPAMVAVAVSAYCDDNGQCRGPAGANGTNGTNGQNGSDAEPITAAQLESAVSSYCSANNGCRGPAGADGEPGEPGEPGQTGATGVVSVVDNCDEAPEGQVISNFNATYDSETQTITYTCTYKDDLQGGILPENPDTPQEG